MGLANKQNPECQNCNKAGLAILPVRYTVVPNEVKASLPLSMGAEVRNVELRNHKYALRTLRQGFFYLYYEKHARGSFLKWEVYSVSARGTLWKQISEKAIFFADQERCSRKEHSIPASVIVVESPEKCGRVWMAFSEHAWSEQTFLEFESNLELRNRRMQIFNPKDWISSQKFRDGLPLNPETLNEVIEYKDDFVVSSLAGNNIENISSMNGGYKENSLARCATRYPLAIRKYSKKQLVDVANEIGTVSENVFLPPIIIGLWDHLGLVHELNGFRNDAAGWIEKYNQERELQIGALNAIEGAKIAFRNRSTNRAEATVFKWDRNSTQIRLARYERARPSDISGRARQADLCHRWERDAIARVPKSLAARRAAVTHLPEVEWRKQMAETDKMVASATTPNGGSKESWIQNRDRRLRERVEYETRIEWKKYDECIDNASVNVFKENRRRFVEAATRIIDSRTDDLVAWLRSKNIKDALSEFHQASEADCVAFEVAVGDMIFGISSSVSGAQLIEEWASETNVHEGNFLWRTIASNHQDGIEALKIILVSAKDNIDQPLTESALSAAEGSLKHLAKISDLSKKSLSLHNTLRKSGVYSFRTGGMEKILMTVGDIFLRPFVKRGVDLLSERLVSGVLLAYSGVDYAKIIKNLLLEAKFGKIGREETLLALSIGHVVAAKNVGTGYDSLRQSWKDMALSADVPKSHNNPLFAGGFNEAKELRFGMVATILQLAYFSKLYIDAGKNPDDGRLESEMQAAGMALAAGVIDLGATGVKAMFKDTAMTFQALKLFGGMLSAGAAWIMYLEDRKKALEYQKAGSDDISRFYHWKSYATFGSGACSFLTSLTYTAPAFEAVAARFPKSLFGRSTAIVSRGCTAVAARLLFCRALLMFGGVGFAVAAVGIQLVIWGFSDDELQDWCSRCAFGKNKEKHFANPTVQMQSYDYALKEVT